MGNGMSAGGGVVLEDIVRGREGRTISHVWLEDLLGMHRVIYLEFSSGVVDTFHTCSPVRREKKVGGGT